MDQKQSPAFLRGRRVILRPFGRDDLPVLTRWINDPEVREYIGPFLPKTEIAEEEWLHKQTDNASEVILAIETVEEGRLIGSMGLHQINWKDRVAPTGAPLGEKGCWGKGDGPSLQPFRKPSRATPSITTPWSSPTPTAARCSTRRGRCRAAGTARRCTPTGRTVMRT